MNINDRDEIADAFHGHAYTYPDSFCECDHYLSGSFADYAAHLADVLVASPAMAQLLAAARDEARAESETPADILDGTGVTANTWQSAARRLADENRALLSAFDGLRRTLNEIRGGTR